MTQTTKLRMTVRTGLKAGGMSPQHNRRTLTVRSQGGGITWQHHRTRLALAR